MSSIQLWRYCILLGPNNPTYFFCKIIICENNKKSNKYIPRDKIICNDSDHNIGTSIKTLTLNSWYG